MEDVQLILNAKNHGAFLVMEGNERIAEMEIAVDDKNVTVYHTEVSAKAEGKGLAKKLLDKMVIYAREHKLMVIPLCPFVHAQFKRHPDQYADIWNRQSEERAL